MSIEGKVISGLYGEAVRHDQQWEQLKADGRRHDAELAAAAARANTPKSLNQVQDELTQKVKEQAEKQKRWDAVKEMYREHKMAVMEMETKQKAEEKRLAGPATLNDIKSDMHRKAQHAKYQELLTQEQKKMKQEEENRVKAEAAAKAEMKAKEKAKKREERKMKRLMNPFSMWLFDRREKKRIAAAAAQQVVVAQERNAQKDEIKLGNTISESLGMKTISEVLFGKTAPVEPIAEPVAEKPVAEKPVVDCSGKQVDHLYLPPVNEPGFEQKMAKIEKLSSMVDAAKQRAEKFWDKSAALNAEMDSISLELKLNKGDKTKLNQKLRITKSKKILADIHARQADDYVKRLLNEIETVKNSTMDVDEPVAAQPVKKTTKKAEKQADVHATTDNNIVRADKNATPVIQIDNETGEEFVVLRGKWVDLYREHMRIVSMKTLIDGNKPVVQVVNGGNVYAESESVVEPVKPIMTPMVSINDKYIQAKREYEAGIMTVNKKYAEQRQAKSVAENPDVAEPVAEPVAESVAEPVAEQVVSAELNRDEYNTMVIKNMSDKMNEYHGVVAASEKNISQEEVEKKQKREDKTTEQMQKMDETMNNSKWMAVLNSGKSK